MESQGFVEKCLSDGRVLLRLPSAGCAGCAGCGNAAACHGLMKEVLDPVGVRPGERVRVLLPEIPRLAAAVLYLAPALVFLLALLLCGAFGGGTGFSAGVSVGCFVAAALGTAVLRRRIGRRMEKKARILEVI